MVLIFNKIKKNIVNKNKQLRNQQKRYERYNPMKDNDTKLEDKIQSNIDNEDDNKDNNEDNNKLYNLCDQLNAELKNNEYKYIIKEFDKDMYDDGLLRFEDNFSPLKFKAYLMYELKFDKSYVNYLASQYEKITYNPIIELYKFLDKTPNAIKKVVINND